VLAIVTVLAPPVIAKSPVLFVVVLSSPVKVLSPDVESTVIVPSNPAKLAPAVKVDVLLKFRF
jgi:hypothetical protein